MTKATKTQDPGSARTQWDLDYCISLYILMQYNVKYNWLILCSKSIRLAITIHIASQLFLSRGKKLITSVIKVLVAYIISGKGKLLVLNN